MPHSVLCYTVSVENEEGYYQRQVGAMVASLLCSSFRGDIKIIHNGERELFPGVEEIGVNLSYGLKAISGAKYHARNALNVDGFDWVLFSGPNVYYHVPITRQFNTAESASYQYAGTKRVRDFQFFSIFYELLPTNDRLR